MTKQWPDEIQYDKVVCELVELWRDEHGYSMNDIHKRVEFYVTAGTSDLAIARQVKAHLNVQGMRKDGWAANDFSWRQGGLGDHAYVS